MNAFLSWMLFLALSGVTYYIYAKPQLPWESKSSGGDRIVVTKGKAVLAGVEEKIEKATNKKKKKGGAKEAPKVEKPKAEKPKAEKPKAEKPAKQEKATKQEKKTDKKAEKKAQKAEPVSSSSSSSSESDSDVAEEEDPKEMIRRLAAARSGTPLSKPEGPSAPKASKSARGRKNAEKQTLATSTGASRASSTGADADIDEGEWSRPSGSDPSDMIEPSGSGPRVLNIIPSAQPPKERKQKEKSESPAPGAQSKKNQKKREKAKAAREEELAQLQASREQHRAAQRAEEAAKPKPAAPAPAPAEAAWTTVNGKKVAAPTPKPTAPVSASGLLDTLRPSSSSTDDDRQNMTHSSYLDQSHWQEIPKDIMDDTEWSTVPTKGKKERKTARDDSGANTPAPVEEKKVVTRPKPSLATSTATMVRTKSTNGFEALSDDARSSDWAEVEGWEVNPQ